ncbi:MAG: type III pantothenate kinase [Armatimonadota bacterium]|nr:type III pantothenate kinase [Armatimonadota bacterium]MDR5675011.1 type III pantothenate kinase [Armatimonadota bacterium]MDR5689271.1 type III pantothenate kinase [Armatimonadota bacterium]MDR7387467.1 type III pantothenate kinase [Armatimonadota bacterium]MDR7389638.1 type III pantothenate kinase [Armatimonadota bacterium]
MLLAVNVNNTQIKLAVYSDPERDAQPRVHWRVSTELRKTEDEYGILFAHLFEHAGLGLRDVTDVAVSCVVPPLLDTMERLCERYFRTRPLVVGPGIRTGMRILYENPREVGADRICNAVAAFAKYGGPSVVCDFGTATTFTAVSREGDFLGGAIAPGIGISLDALAEHTAQLPRIDLEKPRSAIGRSTVAAMQAGVYYGFVGQVEEIVRRIQRELGEAVTVIATGGWARLLAEELTCIHHHDPLLTLEGLRILFLRNRRAEAR